jgi:hypothetical protein
LTKIAMTQLSYKILNWLGNVRSFDMAHGSNPVRNRAVEEKRWQNSGELWLQA